jgi:hypothetical protein
MRVNWEGFWRFFLTPNPSDDSKKKKMENAEGVIGRKQIIEELKKVTSFNVFVNCLKMR